MILLEDHLDTLEAFETFSASLSSIYRRGVLILFLVQFLVSIINSINHVLGTRIIPYNLRTKGNLQKQD